MRRRVYYDASSTTAAAAASLLAQDFDVRELPAAVRPAEVGEAVLIVAADGRKVEPADRLRIVALVDAGFAGPWPDHLYALLPVGASRPVIVSVVRNAFRNLDAAADVARLDRELSELNAIGIRLSAERDPAALLDTILATARQITGSDAGSLYLIEENEAEGARKLRFALAQNDSIDVPFKTVTLPLTSESVAGYVALTGQVVNLEDAYDLPPGSPFRINRSFDEKFDYRTKSMLVVPMKTPQGEIIGALQLINSKPDFARGIRGRAGIEQYVVPFDARHEKLAGSLASQAAVALHNNRLYENIRQLFEGFVKASVTAIESRDPTTSGHSFRVADLTVGLAETVDRVDTGIYAPLRFTPDEIMELRYASLLHDFGKVGVREQVLVKAKKLYPGDLERIRQRVELIKRSVELRYARRKIEHLLNKGAGGYDGELAGFDAELAAYLTELDDSLGRVVMANEPAVLPHDVAEEIERLARRSFEDHLGNRQTVVTPEEAGILAIPRGSLTRDEYKEIQSHVVHTFQFLSQIPWTKEFRRIPEIARSHHEKLNGSGYPYGMRSNEIPVQSKMMTISDIYDALTAADRPYKKAIPIEKALDILNEERRAELVDGDLLDLFIDAKVYQRAHR